MTDVDASLSQSRLDESRDMNGVSRGSFRSQASSGTGEPNGPSVSRLDASGFDGNASVSYSESERPSKPHSSKSAASQRAGSTVSGRSGLSQSGLGHSTAKSETGAEDGDDEGSAHSEREEEEEGGEEEGEVEVEDDGGDSGSVSGSVAASALTAGSKPSRYSAPQSNRAPSTASGRGGGGSRLASEANFGLDAEDDAVSAVSGKSSAVAAAYKSPSLASAHNRSRQASESSLGRSMPAGDDDDGASVTPSERSKPRSSPAPSQRGAPSTLSTGGGGGGGSRTGSETNMGFSGFSMPGGKSAAVEEDNDSVSAGSPAASRSAGGGSRKPSEPGGGASTLSEAGGRRSARTSGASGRSYDKYGEAEADTPSSAAAPTRRRSFASSLRQSVASHKTASPSASEDEDGSRGRGGGGATSGEVEGEATAAASRGGGGDDAASTRSGYSMASSKARSAVSRASGRSAVSAAPSSHTVKSSSKAAKTEDDYGDEGFEEEPVEDDDGKSSSRRGGGQEHDEEEVVEAEEDDAPARSSAVYSESVAPASKSSRPASRQSTSRSSALLLAAAAATSAGYSQEFEAGSQSARHSAAAPSNDGSASRHGHAADDDGAGSAVSAGARSAHSAHSAAVAPISAGGSIFQPPPSEGNTPSSRGGRGGGSVFRRLPADAPDEDGDGGSAAAAAAGLPPRAPSVRSSQGGADGTAGGEWNEGAVRVAAPGARPQNARPGQEPSSQGPSGARSRPMSAAPRDRQSAILDGLIRKHPATWDTVDVATWVEFLGLGQYRRRFLHHCIDGRLLLRLGDQQLKSELGIGPMGHRCAILDAAANLIKNYKEAQRDRIAAGEEDTGNDSGADGAGGAGGRPEMQRSSTAPRPRPASARTGALTAPPPPPGSRRPASASRSVIPPDPFLGPAMGKVTVYEQRAKLLFELDRAQARAEQHRALAEQLRYTATLSTDEVNHIRGLLVEIENKNRAAFEISGGVDSAARIPWRHVGNGTKHNNWYPERFARPGDPETVDMTFQPRTNAESRKIVGGGDYGENSGAVNSFLDRLNNDLRKREQSRKELERRYYGDGPGSAQTQAEQDFNLVAEQLSSRCRINLDRDPAEYESQINEALDKLSNGESWREANLQDGPIRTAKGPAKIAAFASALRSLSFMERYRSDLKSKGSRMQTLERKWINQTLGSQYLPGGKDKEDLDEAVRFFALLGWRDSDGSPSEDAIDSDLLDRLLDRALEYRKRFDVWWERVRDKPEDRAAGFKCDVNWFSSPWDVDGLAQLMDAEMKRMGDGGGGGAAGGNEDFVMFTVRLLGKCREDDLRRLQALNTKAKRLAVYRAIRTQKFIEFTQKDLEERDRKLRQAYKALAPQRRKIDPSRIEGFFERLVEDAARRRAKAEKIEHDKVQREKEILASSVMYGRLRSGR